MTPEAIKTCRLINDLNTRARDSGVTPSLIEHGVMLRDVVLTLEKESYINRTEHIPGGLSVTCVCDHTTHFSIDEIGAFALDMACPNCGRIFWQGKSPRAYKGIHDRPT